MDTENHNRKRKYYSPDAAESEGASGRVFLLRYQDTEKKSILQEGPFINEEDAKEKLSSFLRKGICSWLVSYNG